MNNQDNLSATEKFAQDINDALSQYYSSVVAERVKRGLLNRVKNGYAITRPPLGYSKTETPGLFKVNRLGRALREILKKLASDETNIEFATMQLALTFYSSNAGLKMWNTTKTKRLMSDPYYAGYICYKGQQYSGLHEPLITENEHKKLLALVQKHEAINSLKSVDKTI